MSINVEMQEGFLRDRLQEAIIQTDYPALPRLHGNGYIQLNVRGGQLHFWGHPDVPRQKVYTPIHDHTYSFESTVLRGRFFNVTYKVSHDKWGRYEVWIPQVPCNGKDRLYNTGIPAHVYLPEVEVMEPGDVYVMNAGDYHETLTSGLAVTYCVKIRQTPEQMGKTCHILIPKNAEPDQEFDRFSLSPGRIWQLIGDYK